MCVRVVEKEHYMCLSGCSLKESISGSAFLCWSQTLQFVLFGMVCNICLFKKTPHLLFQDSSSYHINVKVTGFYVGKSNTSVLQKYRDRNMPKEMARKSSKNYLKSLAELEMAVIKPTQHTGHNQQRC